jgi:hypothetical protein
MDAALASEVRERAGHVCEYCRMPEAFYPTLPFPIDHIIARQHGGLTDLRQYTVATYCSVAVYRFTCAAWH